MTVDVIINNDASHYDSIIYKDGSHQGQLLPVPITSIVGAIISFAGIS